MQIIELDDLSRPELAPFARLTEAQLRNRRDPEQGLFIAESPKVIEKALDAGCQPVSFLMERRHIDGQGSGLLARCGGVPVYTGDRELLAELTGFALTRGILCAMRRPALPEVSALCASARRLAVLDGIVDPANVGAIFRSAAALGRPAAAIPCTAEPLGSAWVRSFRSPGAAWSGNMPTGPVCSGSKASRRLLWPSGTTPSLSMLQPWPGNPVWPLSWGRRGMGCPNRSSRAATTQCSSPCPTG